MLKEDVREGESMGNRLTKVHLELEGWPLNRCLCVYLASLLYGAFNRDFRLKRIYT